MPDPVAAPSLPAWAEEMRQIFRAGATSQFVLHGNVFDLVPAPDTKGGSRWVSLADFLAACTHTQGLPYLPDLARLEWAVHEAEIAADANGASALLYAPGTRVLASPYPIADLWLAHQDGAALAPEAIDWRAQGALVHRDGYAVRVAALDVEQAHALIELLEGACA